jgi:tol-pal system protein YbgF
MHHLIIRGLSAAALAAGLCIATASLAQDSGAPRSVFDRLFGANRSGPAPQTTGQDGSQATNADLVLRIERLEAELRRMTGTAEQLQHRNRQLETQIRSMGGVPGAQAAPAQPPQPSRYAVQSAPPPTEPSPVLAGRQPDVFDPTQHPDAPGAPHTLGTIPAGPPDIVTAEPPVGVPGGRTAGAPLDLSTLAAGIASGAPPSPGPASLPNEGPLPPPPSRNLSATGAVASVAPPSDSPKDYYDLAYGYVLRKDYALAEEAFQAFLKRFAGDRRAPDAQFWLGESLFQRQRYDAAASAFLDLSTKHASHSKAPDALLRLGQSLAAMKQKEMACATLAEVNRKYPRASPSVKQGVEREQKRAHC